jgi:hypothetical protein
VGGSLSASANNSSANENGTHIFLAGLALQLLSFLTFTCIYLLFLYRVWSIRPDVWTIDARKNWYWDWRALAGALTISCFGILVWDFLESFDGGMLTMLLQIRSVYRTVELAQGYGGQLSTVEAYFYGLDTLPLFIAISIYIPFWPGRFLPANIARPVDEERKSESLQ